MALQLASLIWKPPIIEIAEHCILLRVAYVIIDCNVFSD